MRTYVPLSALLLVFSCLGASPAIGVVDNGPVAEGTSFQTANKSSQITLQNGVDVRLAPRSSGAVFSDHIVLDAGSARVNHFAGYSVQTHQLEIKAADPAAQAVVRIGEKTIEIASLGGALKVNDGGAMLTQVAAGTRLSFQQSGASGAQSTPKKLPSDRHVMYWLIGITGAAALAIGITAAAQGKSPF
jgi:hypothetical protein